MVFLCNITLSPKNRYVPFVCNVSLANQLFWMKPCNYLFLSCTYKRTIHFSHQIFCLFSSKNNFYQWKKIIQEIKRERFLIKDIFRLPWLVKLSVFCTTLHLLQRKWFSLTLIRAIHILVRFRDQQTTVT